MNIEIIRNTLYKAYLESFYNFCKNIGGETEEVSKCDKTFLKLEALNLLVIKEYFGHKCYLCNMILSSITAIAGPCFNSSF